MLGLFAGVLAALLGPSQDNQGEWKRRVIPWARLSAELPADPQRLQPEPRLGNQKQVEGQQAGRLQYGGVIFRFAFTAFPAGSDVDIEMAAQGALSNLKNTVGVTELKFRRTDLKTDGLPGIRLETWYQYQAKPVSYWIVILGEKAKLWQASAIFKTADAGQEGMAKRMLDSVRVEKLPTP